MALSRLRTFRGMRRLYWLTLIKLRGTRNVRMRTRLTVRTDVLNGDIT